MIEKYGELFDDADCDDGELLKPAINNEDATANGPPSHDPFV